MKKNVVNSGFLPPKVEKPTQMVGSLGWSQVRSSVGGEAELAALLSPVLGEVRYPVNNGHSYLKWTLAVSQSFWQTPPALHSRGANGAVGGYKISLNP